jgi:hypothetical protein
LIVI